MVGGVNVVVVLLIPRLRSAPMVSDVVLVVLHASVPVHCAPEGLAEIALTEKIAAARKRMRTIFLSRFRESRPPRRTAADMPTPYP
jgi:hypothetical protein